MNSGSDSINVYADAKSEYTRQLCQILGPCIQIFFLDLIKVAKEKDQDPKRLLWNFQSLLQEIPDWNQDKVVRETDTITKNSNCDYLEDLLTAVFIAHTKVLSAIRITTKQKKLQITIPKLDHFLHRTLRETGRLLWGNAFLFAEQGPSIERQKNMRQIETLIQEGIQQSIRSLLPVKSILREYLNDEGEDEETEKKEDEDLADTTEEPLVVAAAETVSAPVPVPVPVPVPAPVPVPVPAPVAEVAPMSVPMAESAPVVTAQKGGVVVTKEEAPVTESASTVAPTFFVDTEHSVGFTNMDQIFSSEHPDENEISASPRDEQEEIERIETLDLPPEPMDNFEDLDGPSNTIDFEELA
jgi:hypothetical protein